MKKAVLIFFLGVPFLLVGLFFVSAEFKNSVYFMAWHFKILPVPNISNAIASQNDSLLTLNFKSPNDQTVKALIKSFEYLQKLNKSVADVEARVDSQFKDLGISRQKRNVASQKPMDPEALLSQFRKMDAQNAIEITLGIGVKEEAIKNIETSMKDPKAFASNSVNAVISFRLPKSAESAAVVGLFSADPSALIRSFVNDLKLEPNVAKKINEGIAKLQFSSDYRFGIPAFKLVVPEFPSKEVFITIIGREYIVIASDSETFQKLISNLENRNIVKSTRSADEIIWGQLNLAKIVEGLPEKFRIFVPAFARDLKSLTLNANLSTRVNFGVTIDFTNPKSASEAMLSLNMLKGYVDARKPKNAKLRETADAWINKYYSMVLQESSIVTKVDFPLSDPQGQLENYLRSEFKNLSQDVSALGTVIQYMKSNKLIQIKLKDLNNPSVFSATGFGIKPFQIHSGAILSATHSGTSFRPLMLVTEAKCEDESKFELQLKNKAKLIPLSMYKLHQDPKTSQLSLAFDNKSVGIQVFVLSGSEFSTEWELLFQTPVAEQLDTFKVNNVKGDYSAEESSRTMVTMKSNNTCEIPFEPFLLAQAQN